MTIFQQIDFELFDSKVLKKKNIEKKIENEIGMAEATEHCTASMASLSDRNYSNSEKF